LGSARFPLARNAREGMRGRFLRSAHVSGVIDGSFLLKLRVPTLLRAVADVF
jgi:hypothetical protein